MGTCSTAPRDEMDRQVQKEIDKDKVTVTRVHKLLLLGAGGSGKSTFFKQLKTIHGDGHNDREKEGFRRQVYGQIIESMQTLIRQCQALTNPSNKSNSDDVNDDEADDRTNAIRKEIDEEEMEDFKIAAEFEKNCKYLLDIPSGSALMNDQLATYVSELWDECTAIRKMYEHRNKICVPDSTSYFMKEINRIKQSDYTPSNNDILFVRYRTAGMTEKEFKIQDAIFRIHDVGGQRSERKKWIHLFDGVTAVLFVVSLTCYDEVPFEEVSDLGADLGSANNMLESVQVFKDTLGFRCFEKTGFILFFNKSDLMEEKIKRVPITVAFPDYDGPQEFKPSVSYIKNYFTSLNKTKEREMFSHVTTATDTANVEKVFGDVQQCVVNWSLKIAGLV